MSPLQVDLPPGVVERWLHTATIAWAGEKQVMVMVHGGLRGSDTIADTTIIQFGELPWNVGLCMHFV